MQIRSWSNKWLRPNYIFITGRFRDFGEWQHFCCGFIWNSRHFRQSVVSFFSSDLAEVNIQWTNRCQDHVSMFYQYQNISHKKMYPAVVATALFASRIPVLNKRQKGFKRLTVPLTGSAVAVKRQSWKTTDNLCAEFVFANDNVAHENTGSCLHR